MAITGEFKNYKLSPNSDESREYYISVDLLKYLSIEKDA